MSIFASFLEELEACTAIEDCLKRFARAEQKHGMDDPLYRLKP